MGIKKVNLAHLIAHKQKMQSPMMGFALLSSLNEAGHINHAALYPHVRYHKHPI